MMSLIKLPSTIGKPQDIMAPVASSTKPKTWYLQTAYPDISRDVIDTVVNSTKTIDEAERTLAATAEEQGMVLPGIFSRATRHISEYIKTMMRCKPLGYLPTFEFKTARACH